MSEQGAELASKTCEACSSDTPPMQREEIAEISPQLPEWEVVEDHHLRRAFRFKNFREALDFVNKVGELAEEQGHHPEIHFGWGHVELEVWTHHIGGLAQSDFVFAAKVDRI